MRLDRRDIEQIGAQVHAVAGGETAFATNAEMSAMVFSASLSDDRAVKVDRCEMFEIWFVGEVQLRQRPSKPDKWERSEIMLPRQP